MMPATGLRPPAQMLVAAHAVAPVTLMSPNMAETTFAILPPPAPDWSGASGRDSDIMPRRRKYHCAEFGATFAHWR